MDDETLVRRTLEGDTGAYAQLYRRRCRLITRMCYDTTRDASLAADLAQDAFLRAYDKLGELRKPDRFGSWLIGITRHVCSEWRRARTRDRERMVAFASEADRAVKPSADTTTAIHAALSNLTDQERLVVHAFYIEGRRIEELTEQLELSRASLYRVLARARERLRAALEQSEARR